MGAVPGGENICLDNIDGTSSVYSEPSSRQYAVTVRHAQIQYTDVCGSLLAGRQPTKLVVLKDFNMTVQKGHIYGLLGASGCGKTSLLRAIIGQNNLTSGEIQVLGHKPNSPASGIPGTTVGYMPQELCLNDYFTIEEILYFYGHLSGMNINEINNQSVYLTKLLDIPKTSRILSSLSGGQQRRVSFAIALLHSPPVLILDEPTVGVDPLLRDNIWKYLFKIVKTKNTTVLITTHYIEEATQANIVGLMRNGKLMAEENPHRLIQYFQCSDLEKVLYRLSLLQSTNKQTISSNNETLDLRALPQVNNDDVRSMMATWTISTNVPSMKRITTLLWKDVLTYYRQYFFTSAMILLAFIITALFCAAIGGNPKNINIAVFNQETNCHTSKALAQNIDTGSNKTVNCNNPESLSCRILSLLEENEFLLLSAESEGNAESLVRRGIAWAAIKFDKNFTSALMERAHYSSPYDADDVVISSGTIRVAIDSSDLVVSMLVQTEMVLALKKVLDELNNVCHTLRHIKDVPIQFKTPIYGGGNTNFLDYAVPGIVAGTGMMLPLTFALSGLLPEKISGTLERNLVAGVKIGEIVLSQFIACLGPAVMVVILLAITPYIIFQRYMIGSLWHIIMVCGSLSVVGICFGFILAIISPNLFAASMGGSAFYLTCILASGTLWPVEGVHHYIQWLCWYLPMTLPTTAIREVALRGWGLRDRTPKSALVCTSTWALGCLVVLFILLRLQQRF